MKSGLAGVCFRGGFMYFNFHGSLVVFCLRKLQLSKNGIAAADKC